MDSTIAAFTRSLTADNVAANLLQFGWKVAGAILVLVVGLIAMRLMLTLLRSTLKRVVRDVTVATYIANAARIMLWAVLLVVVLSVFGIETTALAALLGAAGLAVGLALQGSLSNFAAGFMLLLFRPFRSGDSVEVAGVNGRVVEIGIFSTIVDTPENVRAFVPNSAIFNGVIRNRSANDRLRAELKVTVDATSDIARVHQIIQRVMLENDMVLDTPRPDVAIVDDTVPGITFAIRPHARLENLESVRAMLAQRIREELRASEIIVLK